MNLVDLPVYRLIFPVEGPQSYVHVEKGVKKLTGQLLSKKITLVERYDVTDEDKVNSSSWCQRDFGLSNENKETSYKIFQWAIGVPSILSVC